MTEIERQKEPKIPDALRGIVVDAFDRSKSKPEVHLDLNKYKKYIKTLPEAVIAISYLLYKSGKREFTAYDIVERTRFFYWVKYSDSVRYISTILSVLAKNGLLRRVKRGVYTFNVDIKEIENKWPSELARQYYRYDKDNEKKEERKAEPKADKEVNPYLLLLVLKGRKPLEVLPEPYRLLVEFIKKPNAALRKLPAFRRLLEDQILEVEVRAKIKL